VSKHIPIDGVMWCPVHAGVLDEIKDGGDKCDMADRYTPDPCDPCVMFYQPNPEATDD